MVSVVDVVNENSRLFCLFNNNIFTRGGGGFVRQSQTKDWQENEENLVVECFNRVPIPKV